MAHNHTHFVGKIELWPPPPPPPPPPILHVALASNFLLLQKYKSQFILLGYVGRMCIICAEVELETLL